MESVTHELKGSARHLKLFGALTLILGCLAIIAPFVAGLSVVTMVGVLVIAGGIMRMLWAFQMGSVGKGILMFAIGGLTLLCGLSLLAHPLFAFGVLSLLIAFYLFADGIAELFAAFRPQQTGRTWLLLSGVASLILGVVMWRQFPLSGGLAIGVLLGVKLICIGSAMLAGGSAAGSLARGSNRPLSRAV